MMSKSDLENLAVLRLDDAIFLLRAIVLVCVLQRLFTGACSQGLYCEARATNTIG